MVSHVPGRNGSADLVGSNGSFSARTSAQAVRVHCGCLQRELLSEAKTGNKDGYNPGHARQLDHPSEYRVWAKHHETAASTSVCKEYVRYGGGRSRRATVRNDFSAFLRDLGERPSPHSIDRIDNAVNYDPGNCRWATQSEQHESEAIPQK